MTIKNRLFLITGVLVFCLVTLNSVVAGEIFRHDDGTGWEYGRDVEGRPTTTIHYRKDPYEWSIHKGGKEVRTYDPETRGIIHNEFFNDEGVRQWEEAINPETGDTTATSYFNLDGNPEVTTRTYNNYWVKEAASQRRGEPQDGWLDQFTKDDRSQLDGFDKWAGDIDKGLQGWMDQWKDFISGGSLGIKKESIQDAPAQPDKTAEPKPSDTPPTPPSTGQWDFLKEYDPRDFTPESQSSSETTETAKIQVPAGKKQTTPEERDKRYDQMIEEERKKKNEKTKTKFKSSTEAKSAFSNFDALQNRGLGSLNSTPTGVLAGFSGRDMTSNFSDHSQKDSYKTGPDRD